jgi:hypothetical protein
MKIKRISWTLLIAAMIVISATVSQAQSMGRRPSGRGDSANNPAPVAELETGRPETQVNEQGAPGGMLDVIERQKTAIVGSWLGATSEGNKLIATYNSDGTTHGSVQSEVSTDPQLGVLTPAHGVWKHLGGRQFGVTSLGILYNINTGAYEGMAKVRILLTLNEAGDQMTGTDKVEIILPDGTVIPIPSGTTPYTRIKFEPFN